MVEAKSVELGVIHTSLRLKEGGSRCKSISILAILQHAASVPEQKNATLYKYVMSITKFNASEVRWQRKIPNENSPWTL